MYMPGGIRPDGQVDRPLELGERDDLVHQLANPRSREPVDRAVQEDVLAAREVEMEARAQLEQRRHPAVGDDAAGGRPEDPRHQLQQGRLAGAVAADQPERLPRRDLERDIVERDDLARRRASPGNDGVLEGAVRPFGDLEALRDPVDDDAAGRAHRLDPTGLMLGRPPVAC